MKAVPRLKATAVPTIHKPLSKNNTGTDTVSHTTVSADTTPLSTCVTSSAVTACVGSVTVHEPRVSKLRGAYVKRQRKRIINEALASADISDKLASECSSDDPVHTELTVTADQAIQISSVCHWITEAAQSFQDESKKVPVTPVMAHMVYVERLMDNVIDLASMYSMKDMECILAQRQQAPKPLCAEFEDKRPSKAEAIQQHQTRFKLT